jgi:hypothetical protein
LRGEIGNVRFDEWRLSRDEVVGIIMQIAVYAGFCHTQWPVCCNGVFAHHEADAAQRAT